MPRLLRRLGAGDDLAKARARLAKSAYMVATVLHGDVGGHVTPLVYLTFSG
jgi:hypothetical protein